MTSTDAAVVAIGDEIALGERLDTNSSWIADRLASLGAFPRQHVTLDDDRHRIAQTLRRLAAEHSIVVCTGGLGPTPDDLTRQALADAMREDLIEDEDALRDILAMFERSGRSVSDLNRAQAQRPSSARCLRNDAGTAPGLHARIVREDGSFAEVFCLPGPPREMRPMFEREVAPLVSARSDRRITTRLVRVLGVAESDAAARLGDLLARDRSPTVGVTASAGELTFRIRHTGDPARAEREIERAASVIREEFGALVSGEGEESSAASTLGLLIDRGQTLAVAESCTGGLLGATLTQAPGASAAFLGGWITYSDDAKRSHLSVPVDVLERHGAVSVPVARAMAEGALVRSDADHAIAITGVAGPGGGSEEKPVGLVYIARSSRDLGDIDTEIRRFVFPGEREIVRIRSVRAALAMLRLRVLGAQQTPLVFEQPVSQSV